MRWAAGRSPLQHQLSGALPYRARCSPGDTMGAEGPFRGRRVPTAAPGKRSAATAAPSGPRLQGMSFPPEPRSHPGAGAAARSSCLVQVTALQRSPVTA